MPHERISHRIVEQLHESSVSRCGHEIVEVVQVLNTTVQVRGLAP